MTQGSAASACTCEECSRYKVMPVSYEQFSAPNDIDQQHLSVSMIWEHSNFPKDEATCRVWTLLQNQFERD
ncbi:hypothetical protein KI688_005433 [Linnemannia hyalina]|uniref:Uncharacterized protein n=1 Tax=Linnemannia hyalina TaxID=64524 RepID=A0A9P7XLX7_9FUNG|nr:hypothetical protein KI688_005433 [Linnemannia hyalina]